MSLKSQITGCTNVDEFDCWRLRFELVMGLTIDTHIFSDCGETLALLLTSDSLGWLIRQRIDTDFHAQRASSLL